MRKLDYASELIGVGLRRHTVTEIEDVRAGRAAPLQHVAHMSFEHLPRRLQQGGVDVALHSDITPEDAGRLIERLPPVDANGGCDAVEAHVAEERSRADA